ncbi:MAG TPA: sensor domain-containing diguanylate cyclase [Candidatus Limnocylindrales bacterium]|nr:sensor domain-containing diguanylate cyclase [Candidatus Limnocylindrales bacterium]
MEKSAKMFQAVFENSPVGLVLVNKDTTLRDVNNYMFSAFKLAPKSFNGQRFGNLFNCAAISGNDETCGEPENCAQCSLRDGVAAVLNDGVTIPDTVIGQDFIISRSAQKKWFKISASRIVSEGDIFVIVSFVDITVQKEYEELLNNRLALDMATGTINKYTLLETLKTLTARREDLTVALVDFDNFKAINDTHGHIVGDRVLNLFSSVALANTRRHDIVGRYGGEEFMLVFSGATPDLLIKALQRIAKSFQKVCQKELKIRPTFSVGIAGFSSEQKVEMDVGAIIAEADANLYLSKNGGKNMITVGGVSIPFNLKSAPAK